MMLSKTGFAQSLFIFMNNARSHCSNFSQKVVAKKIIAAKVGDVKGQAVLTHLLKWVKLSFFVVLFPFGDYTA